MLWTAVLFFVVVPLAAVYFIRMIDDEVEEEWWANFSHAEAGPPERLGGESAPR